MGEEITEERSPSSSNVAGAEGLRALDLGSGHNPVEETGWRSPGDTAQYEFVNMDLYHTEANCKHDFNALPYPFPNDHFDAIFARHTLEHVRRERLVDVIEEINRIAKEGAMIHIRVPYSVGESFASDPTHYSPFCEATFRHFCRGAESKTEFYLPEMFEMVSLEFRFHPKFRFFPKKLLKELMHVMNEVCVELWVEMRVVKSSSDVPYEPKRKYSFQEPMDWRFALLYGALLYGGILVVLLSLLNLILQLAGLL